MKLLASLLHRLKDLVILLLGVTTLLFFILRLAGDPVMVLAGADATAEQLDALRQQYGLDKPLVVQYLLYLFNLLQLDFGNSLASGIPALDKVLAMLPATLLLSGLSMVFTLLVAIPLGAWLGFRPDRPTRWPVATPSSWRASRASWWARTPHRVCSKTACSCIPSSISPSPSR